MNIQTFFDDLRRVQFGTAEAIENASADHAASARLIATAEYELAALRRDLAGTPLADLVPGAGDGGLGN